MKYTYVFFIFLTEHVQYVGLQCIRGLVTLEETQIKRDVCLAGLTMTGSWDLETQQVMSFSVSFFTVLMPAMRGCFVTSSPAHNTTPYYCVPVYVYYCKLHKNCINCY